MKPQDCNKFRTEVLPEINKALAGFGLFMECPHSMKYGDDRMSFPAVVRTTESASPDAELARRREEFERFRQALDLPDCFGKTFTVGKNSYTVWGRKGLRSIKIVVIRGDGVRCQVDPDTLKRDFKPSPAAPAPRRRATS